MADPPKDKLAPGPEKYPGKGEKYPGKGEGGGEVEPVWIRFPLRDSDGSRILGDKRLGLRRKPKMLSFPADDQNPVVLGCQALRRGESLDPESEQIVRSYLGAYLLPHRADESKRLDALLPYLSALTESLHSLAEVGTLGRRLREWAHSGFELTSTLFSVHSLLSGGWLDVSPEDLVAEGLMELPESLIERSGRDCLRPGTPIRTADFQPQPLIELSNNLQLRPPLRALTAESPYTSKLRQALDQRIRLGFMMTSRQIQGLKQRALQSDGAGSAAKGAQAALALSFASLGDEDIEECLALLESTKGNGNDIKSQEVATTLLELKACLDQESRALARNIQRQTLISQASDTVEVAVAPLKGSLRLASWLTEKANRLLLGRSPLARLLLDGVQQSIDFAADGVATAPDVIGKGLRGGVAVEDAMDKGISKAREQMKRGIAKGREGWEGIRKLSRPQTAPKNPPPPEDDSSK